MLLTATVTHLACLTVEFGAALLVDDDARAFLTRRTTRPRLLAAADGAHQPIWAA